MKNQTKYDLKRARRRFAAKFHFTAAESGTIEGETEVIELISVTDTGSDPMSSICLYIFVDPGLPSILVAYKPGTAPPDAAALKSFPKRFDGYPVHYYLQSEYETFLGVKS